MMDEFKKHERLKESKIGSIGLVPAHWQVVKIKYLLKERKERSSTGEEKLLMMSQKYGLVERSKFHAKKVVAESAIGNKMVYKDDLVFNKLKAHLGLFYKSKNEGVGIVSPDYAVYFGRDKVDVKYFEYLFRHPVFIGQFVSAATGIVDGLKRLYTNDLFNLYTLCPPRKEQKAILDFLNEKVFIINKYIKTKEKTITLLQERKAAIINQAVTKGLDPNVPMKDSGIEWLGEIPAYWEVKKIKYLVTILADMVSSKEIDDIYLSLEKIISWKGDYDLSLGEKDFESTVKRFKAGDVLFGRLRPYLAKVVVAESKGVCVGELLVLRPKKQILSVYLKYLFLNKEIINEIDSSTFGAKMPRAKWGDIGKIEVAIPDEIEQKRILNYFLAECSKIDLLIKNAKKEITLIKEYKESLIAATVTGKINVSTYKTETNYAQSTNNRLI